MIYKQPQVFLTLSFLEFFVEKLAKSNSELHIQERKKLIFIEELIFLKSNIYLNLSEPELLLQLGPDSGTVSIAVKMYIKKISSVNRIKSCLQEWNDYVIGDLNKISTHCIIPNYILCHADDRLCKDMEKNYGLIFISRDLSISTSQMNVENVIFGDTEISDPFPFFNSLSRCHSVVIVEPFFLKQEYPWIKRLISGIIGKGLKIGQVEVMIITRSGEGNKKHLTKLKEDFAGVARFEHFERVLLHDRNIFTNSYWISSDYGFMRIYPKGGTKWTNFPLGMYFQDFYERLATNLSFLKPHRHKSDNYLAKGFSATINTFL